MEQVTLDVNSGEVRELSLIQAKSALQRAWAAGFAELGELDIFDASPDRRTLPHPIQAAWRVHRTRSEGQVALLRVHAGPRDWYGVISVRSTVLLLFSRSGALAAAGRMKLNGLIDWSDDLLPHHWF